MLRPPSSPSSRIDMASSRYCPLRGKVHDSSQMHSEGRALVSSGPSQPRHGSTEPYEACPLVHQPASYSSHSANCTVTHSASSNKYPTPVPRLASPTDYPTGQSSIKGVVRVGCPVTNAFLLQLQRRTLRTTRVSHATHTDTFPRPQCGSLPRASSQRRLPPPLRYALLATTHLPSMVSPVLRPRDGGMPIDEPERLRAPTC